MQYPWIYMYLSYAISACQVCEFDSCSLQNALLSMLGKWGRLFPIARCITLNVGLVSLTLPHCKVYYSQCMVDEFDSSPLEGVLLSMSGVWTRLLLMARCITLNVGCVNSTPAHGEVYYSQCRVCELDSCSWWGVLLAITLCKKVSVTYWRSVIFSLNKLVNTI